MEDLKFCYTREIPIVKAGFLKFNSKEEWLNKSIALKAVAYKAKYWEKGHDLKINFLNGASTQINNFKRIISELLDPLDLRASYVDSPLVSEIRISFNYGYGSYSYLGTDALFIPKSSETLNIGWDGDDVMYHEFMHTLNLLHEHQNPNEGIQWNRDVVIKDLSGAPNYWSLEEIEHNVLNKININDVDTTVFDKDSVMLYYFPSSWTLNNFSSNNNNSPSSRDLDFLFSKYGKESVDNVKPVITLNSSKYMELEYGQPYLEYGATAIDNVDGDISNKILIYGNVDKNISGLQLIKYVVTDNAGNTAEEIRTVKVKEKQDEKIIIIKEFLKKLFPTKYRLNTITEKQLLVIAQELNVSAKVDYLKSHNLDLVWDAIH